MDDKRMNGDWDDAYGGMGQAQGVRLMELPLSVLDPWQGPDGNGQPFRPYPPEKLQELAENIKANGVIEAIRVRPRNGRFQILAGHNRCKAAAIAGQKTIPAVVEDVDDDRAAIIMLDSNLQHRERLLPSERARAYQMRLEAIKRQGSRTDLTSGKDGQKSEGQTARDILAEQTGESGRQIQRYIRLNGLVSRLVNLVDKDCIGLTTAVDLSYLPKDDQQRLVQVMEEYEISKISGKQAQDLRTSPSLEWEDIESILGKGEKEPKPPMVKISLDAGQLSPGQRNKLKKDPAFLDAMQKAMEEYLQRSGMGAG